MSKIVFFQCVDKDVVKFVYVMEESCGVDVMVVSWEYKVNDVGVFIVVYDIGIVLQLGKVYIVLLLFNSCIGKVVDLCLVNFIGFIDNDYWGMFKMIFYGVYMFVEEWCS